ncbi:hypothetical protein LCGC14_0718950 [marine sediment metagenome]|uniref:Uncharacterized protein n=1 Tax=marine sediment metagenome TaxID=412755 RepID=A0A0F9QY33_9ZZZZ
MLCEKPLSFIIEINCFMNLICMMFDISLLFLKKSDPLYFMLSLIF